MSKTEATLLLFLGPVLVLAAAAAVHWITGWQDRVEQERIKRQRTK